MPKQETLPSQEQQPPKEQEPFSSHYDGLHIRLILGGEALNPNNDRLPKVEKDKVKSFEQRSADYQVFNQASTEERKKIAEVKEEELEQAIDNWSQKTLKVLSQDFSKRKGFDQQKAQRWQETLNQFLKYIGIDDLSKATKEEIRKKIYDRYFTGEDKESNLYQFVKDVLESQNNDFELIKQNIDFFQWFSNIFGINSSILTSHLIAAESRLKHQPDQLISQANTDTGKKDSQNNPIERRNDLNKEEKWVLRFCNYKNQETLENIFNFFEKFKKKYLNFKINNNIIFIPQEEEANTPYYEKIIINGISLNEEIFGKIDNEKEIYFIFFSKTEDFNEFNDKFFPKSSKKIKGDNITGRGYPYVIFFTPNSLISETDARIKTTPEDYVEEGIKHELTHFFMISHYGLEKTRMIPKWLFEGLSLIIQRRTLNIDDIHRSNFFKDFYEEIKDLKEPPTLEFLENRNLKGRKTPLLYPFGELFLLYLINKRHQHFSDLEKKKILKKIIDESFTSDGRFDINRGFRKIFNTFYEEAYWNFINYLSTKLD